MHSLSFITLLVSVFGRSLKEYCASNKADAQYISIEVASNTPFEPPDCQNDRCLPNFHFFECAQEVFFKYTPKDDVPVDAKLLQDAMTASASKRGYNGIDFQVHQDNVNQLQDYIQYHSLQQHVLTVPYFLYHAHQGDLNESAEINMCHHIVVLFNQTDLASIKKIAAKINDKVFLVAESYKAAKNAAESLAPRKVYVQEHKVVNGAPTFKSFDLITVYQNQTII